MLKHKSNHKLPILPYVTYIKSCGLLCSQANMIEGVSLCGIQRRVGKTQHLVQHILHCTKLVILHRHAALQLRDHHTNISVHRFKGLQLQLALKKKKETTNKWIKQKKIFFLILVYSCRGPQNLTLDLLQTGIYYNMTYLLNVCIAASLSPQKWRHSCQLVSKSVALMNLHWVIALEALIPPIL